MVDKKNPKILLIALKYMGDLLVAAPSIHALRRHLPDSHITVLIRKGLEEIFIHDSAVDEVLVFDYPFVRSLRGFKRLKIEYDWVGGIRRRRFDTVVSLQPGDRFAWWAWLSGAGVRIGPRKQPFGYLFNNRVDVEEDRIDYREYYGKIIAAVGVEGTKVDFKYTFPAEADKWAERFLQEQGIRSSKLLIGLHPGARDPVKLWPAQNFARLAECLRRFPEVQPLFFRGPDESGIIESIEQILKRPIIVADSSSHISHLGALLKRCRLFIGNDSGPRHLAAAVGTQTLTLMHRAKLKTWKIYDESHGHFVLTDKVDNLDSERAVYEASTINTLSSISVDQVYNKVREILGL